MFFTVNITFKTECTNKSFSLPHLTGEEGPQPREMPVQPTSMGDHHLNRANSEYKMKFVEYPHQDRQVSFLKFLELMDIV